MKKNIKIILSALILISSFVIIGFMIFFQPKTEKYLLSASFENNYLYRDTDDEYVHYVIYDKDNNNVSLRQTSNYE